MLLNVGHMLKASIHVSHKLLIQALAFLQTVLNSVFFGEENVLLVAIMFDWNELRLSIQLAW